ncbi:hypothetical protein TTRE_0000141501 [Trichuris trichiura]|uniref:NADH:ubiquinone reductase (H(+)-translocating) n=1 Tax=Trichuris trichiura TaxID=36087 RepID=A0A077YYM7_TRITR|nr:hypothetical protein TTRE_0000141501 [Trichuris trichiura]
MLPLLLTIRRLEKIISKNSNIIFTVTYYFLLHGQHFYILRHIRSVNFTYFLIILGSGNQPERLIATSILFRAGGYGMLKINFLYEFFAKEIRISLILVLVLMSSTLCLLETDLNQFSRVTQLTLLLALLVRDHIHYESRLSFVIISHGLIRNSLFFLVGILSYTSTSRHNKYNYSTFKYWCTTFACYDEKNHFIHYHTFSTILKFYSLSKHILFLIVRPGLKNININSFINDIFIPFRDLFLLTYLPMTTF